tara:strand:- start:522 stop:659 length:138 start_codon:yes stop_codon:yes gene_type:complete
LNTNKKDNNKKTSGKKPPRAIPNGTRQTNIIETFRKTLSIEEKLL